MVATLSLHSEGCYALLCYCLVIWATWVSLVTWATKISISISLLRGTMGKQTHGYRTRYNQLQSPVLPKGMGNQPCATSCRQSLSFHPWEAQLPFSPLKGSQLQKRSHTLRLESTALSLCFIKDFYSHMVPLFAYTTCASDAIFKKSLPRATQEAFPQGHLRVLWFQILGSFVCFPFLNGIR